MVTFDGDWLLMVIAKDTAPVYKLWVAKLAEKGLPANGTYPAIFLHQENLSGLKSETTFSVD